jgi:hypothetical protein
MVRILDRMTECSRRRVVAIEAILARLVVVVARTSARPVYSTSMLCKNQFLLPLFYWVPCKNKVFAC